MRLVAPGRAVATSRIVSDLRTTPGADRIELKLDEAAFPRDAVYAAAFSFIDRCYVRLDRVEGGQLGVELRGKGGPFDGEATMAELRNELFAQSFRWRLADSGRDVTATITAAAFGSGYDGGAETPPNPPDVPGHEGGAPPDDALLADLAAAPFDDPLGIALSWEQKHAAEDGAAPKPAGEGEQGT